MSKYIFKTKEGKPIPTHWWERGESLPKRDLSSEGYTQIASGVWRKL